MGDYGSRIKAAREAANMTQEQLGEKIGVTGVTIMRYEKNLREPRQKQLLAIADALDVPLFSLLGSVSSTDPDFQMVMEYTGLTEQALYTITNGIRTFPGQDFPYNDSRTLTDILNLVLSDSRNFLTILAFIRLATAPATISAAWGNNKPTAVPSDADRRGNEELACDYLRAIIKAIREKGKK